MYLYLALSLNVLDGIRGLEACGQGEELSRSGCCSLVVAKKAAVPQCYVIRYFLHEI